MRKKLMLAFHLVIISIVGVLCLYLFKLIGGLWASSFLTSLAVVVTVASKQYCVTVL